METIKIRKLLDFYRDHLHRVILPFWLSRAPDLENGGFYTCFEVSGQQLRSTDKYVWAQGRMAWVMAKLAELYPTTKRYLELAKSGVDFLVDHAFLDNGHCAFLLTKTGELQEAVPGDGYDTSIYADCFVVMGLAKYAAVSRDLTRLERAVSLYESIIDRIDRSDFRTEPYPVPPGYKAHGVPMIALNTGQELLNALLRVGDRRATWVDQRNAGMIREIMDNFVRGPVILEMIGLDNQPIDSILGSYVNPGHTIEDMWFIMDHAMRHDDQALIDRAVGLARAALELGWDETWGGLFQYVHKNGGPPAGCQTGIECEVMVETVRNNWYNKLWWPHTESLYTFLLAYSLTGDPLLLQDHDRVFSYTFKTFPNPDSAVGEWIQIRDRQGRPEKKVVALPAKDPYHITRNLILIIELLSRMEASGKSIPAEPGRAPDA